MKKTKQRGNGTGTVYKRGDRGTYVAEVRSYLPGEVRRIRKTFAKKKDAVNALPALLKQLEQRTDPKAPKVISFADLKDKLFATQWYKQLSPDKQKAYRIAYNKCAPLHALSDVRFASYEMQAEIISGLTYYPARDVRTLLNKAWELAMRMNCLEKNYAPLLELPPIPQAKKTAFSEEQVKKIQKVNDPFRDYMLLMIYMGLRPVELRGLTVEDVHLDEHYTDGGRKTAKGVPIAIFDEAEPILRKMCEETKTGKLCKLSNDDFYAAFYHCLAAAGVQDEEDHTLTPYTCRHTFVTRLTKAGVPQPMIQKAARHTSYKTTQGYTHLDISDVLKAVNGDPIAHQLPTKV